MADVLHGRRAGAVRRRAAREVMALVPAHRDVRVVHKAPDLLRAVPDERLAPEPSFFW